MTLPLLLKLGIGYEIGLWMRNELERHTYYQEAREYCGSVDKPLLRIGIRKYFWEPPDADYTVDLDPKVEEVSGGVLADERDMPFQDKEFGVCINQHTLEHLDSPDDVQLAVNECARVSDKTILLTPSPYGLLTNIFNPRHNLRLYFDQINNRIRVERNKYNVRQIGQAMIVESAPQITTRGRFSTVTRID